MFPPDIGELIERVLMVRRYYDMVPQGDNAPCMFCLFVCSSLNGNDLSNMNNGRLPESDSWPGKALGP